MLWYSYYALINAYLVSQVLGYTMNISVGKSSIITHLEPAFANTPLSHLIHLDNNLFRLIKRKPEFANKFFTFFDQEGPAVFENIDLLFTWSQFLEDANLGRIITKIKATEEWKKNIESKSISLIGNIFSINIFLDEYFELVLKIVSTMPELQRDQFLDKIDLNLEKFTYNRADVLVKMTLKKCRDYIAEKDYMVDLAWHIAWVLLTANTFIVSNQQWQERNAYFDPLISVWHKLFLEGHELDFYRLMENRYYAYTNYSKKEPFDSLQHVPIKPESDLCDSEIIHFASLGIEWRPVICITMDKERVLEKRLAIMKQSLIDLKRDVGGWKVDPLPGEIWSLSIEKTTKTILGAHIIKFNTPFAEQETSKILKHDQL